MASQSDEVEISIAELTPAQIDRIADVVARHTNKEFLQHQREVLKIKIAAYFTAIPFGMMIVCSIVSTVAGIAGHQWQPADWLLNFLTALTTAALSQMAATLVTLRQTRDQESQHADEKSTIIVPRKKIEEAEVVVDAES